MAVITIRLAVPSASGANLPAGGTMRWSPTRIRRVGDAVVLPRPFDVPLQGDIAVITVEDTGPDWAWLVSEPGGRTRYLAVAGTAEYADLQELDPATLEPTEEPQAAWWASLAALQALVDDLETGGGGGPSGPIAIEDVTGLTTALGNRATTVQLSDGLATKAALTHTHAITDITGLSGQLSTLATAVNGKQPAGSYAPAGDYATNTGLTTAVANATASLTTLINGKRDATWTPLPSDLGIAASGQRIPVATTPGSWATNGLVINQVESASSIAQRDGAGRLRVAVATDGYHAVAKSQMDTALATKADLIGGLIPTSQIPSIALQDTKVVANQAAMLALGSSVQVGDIAVRTDGAGTFILIAADASQLANWTQLSAPTDAVTSVNGQVGPVTLAPADIGAAAAVHAHTIAQVTGLQAALDARPVTPAGASQVNVSTSGGTGGVLGYTKSPTGDTFAVRNAAGTLSVAEATADIHAATRGQMVAGLATKAEVVHAHAIADVTGLLDALSARLLATDNRIPTRISRSAFDLLTPPVPGKVYLIMTDADYAAMLTEMGA